MTLNAWYILGEETTPSGAGIWKDYSRLTGYSFAWSKNPVYIALGYFSGSGITNIKDTSYDWVRVRKYTSPEPSATVGAESSIPTVWADAGGSLSWSSTTSASTSTHRWVTLGAITIENIQSPSISQAIYYEQYLVTISVSPRYSNYTRTSSTNYFNGFCEKFNGTLTLSPIYDGLSQTDWCDYGDSIWASESSSSSTSQKKWLIQGQTYTATASGAYVFLYDVYDLIRLEVASMNKYNISSLMWLQLTDALNTVYNVQPSQYFYVKDNITHRFSDASWRTVKIAPEYFNPSRFNPTTPAKYNFTYTKIWSNLAESGMEIYLESGASAYASIWDAENEVLFVWTTQPETGGSTYLYYTSKYAYPVNVYVGGYKILQGAWTYDPKINIAKVPISGGAFAFDFTGKLAESLTSKPQAIYAPYPVIVPQAVVNVTQPPGYPTVTIPAINVTQIFEPLLSRIMPYYNMISTMIPVPMPIVLTGGAFILLFALFWKLLSRVRRTEAKEYRLETGERIVLKVEPPRFTRMFIQTAITTTIIGTLFYYVFPNAPVLSQYFGRINIPYHIFFIMILVVSLFVSMIVYLILSEGYRVSKTR
jgi:hypothetical protein